MPRAKFCSNCGERLKASRRSALPLRVLCAGCAKNHHPALVTFVALIAFLSAGFLIGRLMTPRREVPLIGAPLSLNAPDDSSADTKDNSAETKGTAQSLAAPAQLEGAAVAPGRRVGEDGALCGAPTKSGRPCRRKVLGGGYCYQHKEKFLPNPNAVPQQTPEIK